MGRPLVHLEVAGKDGKQLQSLYGKLAEWQVDAENPWHHGEVNTGDPIGIKGGIGRTPEGGARHVLRADDPRAYLDKAVRLGGTVVMPPSRVRPPSTSPSSRIPRAISSAP